jgi:hypothetical protein
MKPIKAWAVVDGDGIVDEGGEFVIHQHKKNIEGFRFEGERIVRVEIREVPRKAKR